MKVKELLEKLSEYNLEADISIVLNNSARDFEICYGTSEGCTKENCDEVNLYVKGLNNDEK